MLEWHKMGKKKELKLIVQIPAYNEEEHIGLVIKEIPRIIKGIDKVEVLVIDDGSTDESLQVAQAKMAAKEINTRWQEFMSPFVDSNARPDETFIELEEYFHLDYEAAQ